MKDKVNQILNLINESERIVELCILDQINKDKNFHEAAMASEDSTVIQKLDLNFQLKRIKLGMYSTIVSDNDNQSLNLLRLNNVGSAKTNISPKGTFIKLKKDVIKNLKETFNGVKII